MIHSIFCEISNKKSCQNEDIYLFQNKLNFFFLVMILSIDLIGLNKKRSLETSNFID